MYSMTAASVVFGLALAGSQCRSAPQAALGQRQVNLDEARKRMVEEQIRARGVKNDRVLQSMGSTPRHEFVPDAYRGLAYEDSPLPTSSGQTISQPYIVALMTELIDPRPEHRVLEIGTGSGYQAAVLSSLVREVYTIEIVPELARTAAQRLERLNYKNVHVREGDGYQGWPQYAPFDAILVTAGAAEVPKPLIEQLKRGGRMVIPVDNSGGYQTLQVIEKDPDGRTRVRDLIPVRFVPLVRSDIFRGCSALM
jgi:protein-L-isoaspartate(D-aspartate) O-methyltransferase